MKTVKQFAFSGLFVLLFWLCSCQQEDIGSKMLPEDKYPVTFTATQDDADDLPKTRVSESVSGTASSWTFGDQIKVKVSGNSNDMETTCTLDASGNITAYTPKLFWKTTGNSTINAWYSNITGQNTTSSTVSLANQSGGLAYVLKADEKTGVNYKTGNISLNFKHQLAKVRVKVVKGTYTGDLTGATVKVKGYTSCTVSNGSVTGTTEDYISTLKNGDYFEANLVPQNVSATNFIKIIDKANKEIAVALTVDATLKKGQVHTFTITVNKLKPLYVKLSDITTDTYTFDRDGTHEGDANTYNKSIYIADGATLTIKNVKLKAATNHHAIYGQGTATLILEGTNTADGNSGYTAGVAARTSITIKGTGSLSATGGANTPGIGGGLWNETEKCGDIIIESGTISSTGSWGGSPGAGIGNSCGNITITGGNITATGAKYAAGIGSGYAQYTGSITITGGTVVAIKGSDASNSIGAGNNGGCGTITIDRANAHVTEK